MTYGNQRWHVHSPPQVTTSPSADPRFLFDGSPGIELTWIDSTEGNPLPRIQGARQHGLLADYLQSTGFADSGDGQHQTEMTFQLGVADDESQPFPPRRDPELQNSAVARVPGSPTQAAPGWPATNADDFSPGSV